MKKNSRKFILISFFVSAVLIIALLYWRHQTNYPSTDDAYIQAHVINIAPRVTGQVDNIYINNYQYVHKGQLLFAIDPLPFQTSLKQALANRDETIQQVNAAQSAIVTAQSLLAERKAELTDTQKDSERILTLVKENIYPAIEGDKAQSNLLVAKAALAAAESQLNEAQEKLGHLGGANASIRAAQAQVEQAQLNLSYTKVLAPNTGYIANFTLRPGDAVTAYQPLFALVQSTHTVWAEANFKETDLERIQPGQPATVHVDMYPQVTFHGVVSNISSGSGSTFDLLPPENATGNWVKVTQRFPVRILITTRDERYPLRIGASCEVTINTTHYASP